MTEHEQSLKALKTAIQMEIDGKKYYEEAGRSSVNELGKKLFQTLALEEDKHRKKFEAIFRALEADQGWPEIDFPPSQGEELKTLFSEALGEVKPAASELSAVQTAMEMENKTRDFYLEQAGLSTQELPARYYTLLAGEERAHHSALLDYYEYMKNPADWFTMKERHSLDGG